MTVPTQPVTVRLADFGGASVAGVRVTAKLSDFDYTVDGTFVGTELVSALTDATGTAVLYVFPNQLAPDGLGTRGTTIKFSAAMPGSKSIRVDAVVPNHACDLVDILVSAETPPFTAAQLFEQRANNAAALAEARMPVSSDTPPVNPVANRLWFNTTNGKTYQWFVDADGGQWVETSGFYYVDDPVSVAAAQAARTGAEQARDTTLAARDVTTGARDVTTAARDAATAANIAAQAAKTAAEAARDGANTSARAYTSAQGTAAALADTALAVGLTFAVVAADALSYSVYRKDAGPVATPMFTQYTKGYFDGRFIVKSDRSGYLMAFADLLNQVWFGMRPGGKVDIGSEQDVVPLLASLRAMLGLKPAYDAVTNIVQTTTERSGVLWAVKLGDKKMPIYVDSLGRFWMGSTNLSALFGDATLIGGMQGFFTPTLSLNIDCVGDSITEGAGSSGGSGNYPFQLSQLFGGSRSVANEGIGGQISAQISIRAGGLATMVTVAGNTVPADTSEVAITCSTNPLTGTSPARTLSGWLRGIDGTLVYGVISKASNVSTLTFARAVAGNSVAVDPDTPFLVDRSVMRDRIVIIGAGTNDDKTTPEATIANIQAIVDNLPAIGPDGYKRWGWVNVWGGNTATVGTTAYDNVVAFNRALKARWPNNCIDVRGALMRSSNGSADDNADVAAGILPRSKTADGVHPNDAGYAVYAATVKTYIDMQEASGWLPF